MTFAIKLNLVAKKSACHYGRWKFTHSSSYDKNKKRVKKQSL